MAAVYLHEHKDFPQLLRIIEAETNIIAGLVEKDYWIMHCDKKVVQFIGTEEYKTHKENRFPIEDYQMPISENPAFLLREENLKREFKQRI